MGSLIQRFQNASVGRGWKTHEQLDRKYAERDLTFEQKRGREIHEALTPLSQRAS